MKIQIKIQIVKFIGLIKLAGNDPFLTKDETGQAVFNPELARMYWSIDGIASFQGHITTIQKDMIRDGSDKKDFMVFETLSTIYDYICKSIRYLQLDPKGVELSKQDIIGQSYHWKVNIYQHIEEILKTGFNLI
jgi:hypothetical protein